MDICIDNSMEYATVIKSIMIAANVEVIEDADKTRFLNVPYLLAIKINEFISTIDGDETNRIKLAKQIMNIVYGTGDFIPPI